jgi:L-ribulokinase
MFAATAAGIYPSVQDAMAAMGQGFDAEYKPEKGKVKLYAKRYRKYVKLGKFIEKQ